MRDETPPPLPPHDQETAADDPIHVIVPTLAAPADEDVPVAATTGRPNAAEAGIDVPPTPSIDAIVTDSGFGSVQFAG